MKCVVCEDNNVSYINEHQECFCKRCYNIMEMEVEVV